MNRAKGVSSLDFVFALILVMFVFSWLQGFARSGIGEANVFGSRLQTFTAAVEVGSRMNAFYAWNPKPQDYLKVNKTLQFFNETLAAGITKDNNAWNTTVGVLRAGVNYSGVYPVASTLNYDPLTQKVRTP